MDGLKRQNEELYMRKKLKKKLQNNFLNIFVFFYKQLSPMKIKPLKPQSSREEMVRWSMLLVIK